MRDFRSQDSREPSDGFIEEVIVINRVAKVVKGGRIFGFAVVVAVGDKINQIGLGHGKAREISEAIKKANEDARKNMIHIAKRKETIPFEVQKTFCATKAILKPAVPGHGIIAGGPARIILNLSGIQDVTAKFHGSSNQINCAKATFEALKLIEDPKKILERRRRSGYGEREEQVATSDEPETVIVETVALETESTEPITAEVSVETPEVIETTADVIAPVEIENPAEAKGGEEIESN